MELVEATEDDAGTLVEYWFSLASGMEQYSRFNELVYDGADEVPGDAFRDHFERDDIRDYLVEVDGETVGFLTLAEGTHPSREFGRYTKLVNLFVAAEHRNRGYGTEAIERAKGLAKERGCDHLKVSCEWGNAAARRLYRETGFEEKQVTFVQELG
ncbi:GNAT family N-acetyltransferase [Halobium salinum]|uniref:GNAT family N-acetyltransferase n=1 Tax=Halobium salinum TaxID=1364940 RepID=A0ABD5PD99_9EURY|nr:GNAT family N-acetyltransferase [Halobium salinum]